MKIQNIVLSFVVGAWLSATAQTTAFTYQGRFNDSGSPANGFYDFSFALFDSATNGNQVGSTVIVTNVAVSGGLFTVPVDFGSTPFNGTPLWLQINARTNESVNYTLLSPRQPITSAPYAVFSSNAQAANAVAAGGITGTLNLTQLPPTIVTNGATNINISGNFSGNGNLLTNLSDGALKYLSTAPFSYSIPYSNAGTYSITVPNSATQMVVKLWGAAGAAFSGQSGGGGFSMVTLPVASGDAYTLVVGQGGGLQNGGDQQSNDGAGGAGTPGGGQASSLFHLVSHHYFMKAVAGGGGACTEGIGAGAGGGMNASSASSFNGGYGGSNGIGASGGTFYSGSAGSSYSTNALAIGETSLASMGGDGGSGGPAGSGGGGGYGGGAGSDIAGGGGGSYGDTTIPGNASVPGNTGDPAYIAPSGYGFSGVTGAGYSGLGVVQFSFPSIAAADPITAPAFSGDGSLLTNLNASAITTGTVADTLLSTNVPLLNGANAFLNANNTFAGYGSGLTSLNASAISSGTVADSHLSTNVALLNANQNFTGQHNFPAGVGIGTNSPSASLHVTSPGFPTALIDGSSTTGTWMDVRNTGGGTNWLVISTGSGNGEGAAKLVFETGSNPVSSTAELMALSSRGVSVYGTFNNNSDRNAKQDISPVTTSNILDKVSRLPVSEWSYKVDAATRHIGPMAQDFYSTFKVGTDDKHIAPIDEGGIALAAIQALNVKLEKQAAELKDRDAQFTELQARDAQLRLELDQIKAALGAK
jgi:hypothetical protein